MAVKKNIAFGLRSSKMPKPDKEKRIQEVAEILDMVDLLERKPSQLSGGQRQRVAIGRAMVRDPAVFLFDEPLSNLDAQLRTQMRLEIKKLHQRVGNTIIFVTHDQVEAMTMADRIVVMKDGYIQQVGTPAEVFHKPANTFVARFIGAPSMNLLDGKIDGTVVSLANGQTVTIPKLQAPDRKDVLLGVRPDDLHPNSSNPIITGKVVLREPLGSETMIYVDTPSGEIIAKADGRTPPEVGETVQLGADPENLHVFDAKSGVALT
jgi:multiple sugar transport system ATP-binding protein